MKLHEIKGFIQSMYLVEYPEGLLLLDSGTSADVALVHSYIREKLGRDTEDLKVVVVTHAHPDHSGGASKFQKCGSQIVGPVDLNQWYAGINGFFTYLVDVFLTYVVWVKTKKPGDQFQSVFFPRKLLLDMELKEGDSIPGFPDWSALSCPGHTASDISIYNEKEKLIYVADNLVKTRKGFNAPYPICFPDRYRESLLRYKKLDIEEIMIAHYGRHSFSEVDIDAVVSKIGDKPRWHRSSLLKILIGLFLGGKKRKKS